MIIDLDKLTPTLTPGFDEEFMDLFAGCGGSGDGVLNAYAIQGRHARGTFVNHWDKAINIHAANHPDHRHLITGVDDVMPHQMYPRLVNLNLLWGSPECTHHSRARGGKPVDDQSRASAQCIVRYVRHLRPTHILLENVKEFEEYGPTMQKRCKKTGKLVWIFNFKEGKKEKHREVFEVPFKQKKGQHRWDYLRELSLAGYEMALMANKKKKGLFYFDLVRRLRKMGYLVEWRIFRSADYGDPTIRQRLYVQAVRIDSGKKIVWPNQCFTKPDKKTGVQPKGKEWMRLWPTARNDVIDWSDMGKSIFDPNTKLYAKNTLRRMAIGFVKFALKDFLLPKDQGWDKSNVRSTEEPCSTITTNHRGEGLVQPRPFILKSQGTSDASSVEEPIPTVQTHAKLGVGEARAFMIQNQGQSAAHSADEPVRTAQGCAKHGVVIAKSESFRIPHMGFFKQNRPAISPDEPMDTVTASHGAGHVAQASACLIKFKGTGTANDVEEPLHTVNAMGFHHALMEAFMMLTDQYGGNGSCTYSPDEPARTAVTKANQAVITAEAMEPTEDGELTPFIMDTAHSDRTYSEAEKRVRALLEPLMTICGNRCGQALIRPWIYTFYSGGSAGSDIDAPMPTSTTKDRMALCYPALEFDGKILVIDLRLRMLRYRELARAQGFPDNYQFTGTTTEIVKAIGNSVSRNMACALSLAATSQNPDVAEHIYRLVDEEKERRKHGTPHTRPDRAPKGRQRSKRRPKADLQAVHP